MEIVDQSNVYQSNIAKNQYLHSIMVILQHSVILIIVTLVKLSVKLILPDCLQANDNPVLGQHV